MKHQADDELTSVQKELKENSKIPGSFRTFSELNIETHPEWLQASALSTTKSVLQKKKRLCYCCKYLAWDPEKKTIVWYDEATFRVAGNWGREGEVAFRLECLPP